MGVGSSKERDVADPVVTDEELEELLLEGLESGEPRPMTEEDWATLRRRALADAE